MNPNEQHIHRAAAHQDFSKARMKAFWSELWATITGKPSELLQFDEVRDQLKLKGQRNLGLQEIPLDKIVGTVGRYHDFTRTFLPKKSVSQERWETVDTLARSKGVPPIELYKVGEAYFVIDGNHRVSVARQFKQRTIEAYVIEMTTPIPFDTDTTPEDLDIKGEYADFLKDTKLDILRPNSNLEVTVLGVYPTIIQHIAVHRYFMGIEQNQEIKWKEAVASWYDNVYLPMIEVIRNHDLLASFSDRTETDLYVWLIRHQEALKAAYQVNDLSPEATAQDFMKQIN